MDAHKTLAGADGVDEPLFRRLRERFAGGVKRNCVVRIQIVQCLWVLAANDLEFVRLAQPDKYLFGIGERLAVAIHHGMNELAAAGEIEQLSYFSPGAYCQCPGTRRHSGQSRPGGQQHLAASHCEISK